jgi:LmbE family N-acetylglucosaminyl deacetylase
MNRILIICAHPDDDILGCGGLMAKYVSKAELRVVFIAEGSSCRFAKEEINTSNVKAVIEQRNGYGKEALSVLGVSNVIFYNLPCGRLDQVSILDINKIIESEIKSFKPDTIFTHAGKDANNDHVIVHRSTIMATRPGAISHGARLYAYEVLSSSEWKFSETFSPNYFEVLEEDHVNLKWKALEKYTTEVKEFPYPRSAEGIITLAKYRGMQSGVNYAEAFSLIREIKK